MTSNFQRNPPPHVGGYAQKLNFETTSSRMSQRWICATALFNQRFLHAGNDGETAPYATYSQLRFDSPEAISQSSKEPPQQKHESDTRISRNEQNLHENGTQH